MTAPQAARKGDAVGDHKTGAPKCKITKGCSTVFIEKEQAARISDDVSHAAQLTKASTTVFIAGKRASRKGDDASCTGHVVTHAAHTFIGG